MFILGTPEIIMIVAALFLLFGASRLPKLAKSLGQSRKAFKEGMEEMEKEINSDDDAPKSIESPKVAAVSEEEVPPEMRQQT
ncbi:MAG: twin-arginine translocase TatA/TatE family subunit [Pyrinomonadaceae bacterium]|nr:twin-arginine translocase TatA/TatE family subunit [Pyrinomonadaceae bacterium]